MAHKRTYPKVWNRKARLAAKAIRASVKRENSFHEASHLNYRSRNHRAKILATLEAETVRIPFGRPDGYRSDARRRMIAFADRDARVYHHGDVSLDSMARHKPECILHGSNTYGVR